MTTMSITPSRDDIETHRLIAWIDSHEPRPEPTIDNKDGTVLVASESVAQDGVITIERDIIPATMQAARDLLGY